MPIDKLDMEEITERLDGRYVKKSDCSAKHGEINGRLHSDDKKLAVIEYRMKINNWLTMAIASGIIALVIKVFLGG